jgi:hypothetical protein
MLLCCMSPTPKPLADLSMDVLTARLEALLQHYVLSLNQRHGDGALSADQFREDLLLLIAEYRHPAIDAMLGDLPDASSPSVSRH